MAHLQSRNLELSFTTSVDILSEATMLPRVGGPYVLIGCADGRVRPMLLFAVSPLHVNDSGLFVILDHSLAFNFVHIVFYS